MSKVIRTIRLSETIAPFGPGAVLDILGESFMAVTGDHWPPESMRHEIDCDSLSAKLGVKHLWAPPSHGDPEAPRAPGLEFVRFPAWLFCQECRKMARWSRAQETGSRPECLECNGRMVPMRFVLVCTGRSHAADIPWPEWAHRGSGKDCSSKDHLKFSPARSGGDGLRSLEIICNACGTVRSLAELRGDILLREGMTCRGKQPWDHEWGNCGLPVEVQQRGATSLHFGETVSAIDIPEVEGRAAEFENKIRKHPFFEAIASSPNQTLVDLLVGELSQNLGSTPETVQTYLAVLLGESPPLRVTTSSILAEEFEAFAAAAEVAAPTPDFVTRASAISGDGAIVEQLQKVFSGVVLVDRLREVRVVRGFRRHHLDAEPVPAVPRSHTEQRWLPAAEGYGEGIFLQFNGTAMDDWAIDPAVAQRAQLIATNQSTSALGDKLHPASAQYLALHAFAHVLMQELAFRSGYSAPSLRERVYFEATGDYGVFIYTTSSDIEGTLGGLVRQGEPGYIEDMIMRALEHVDWCPNDPVCRESSAQSIDGLNLAACHACMLAPETSCESFNLLLDRTLLVGDANVRGLFSGVVEQALAAGR